MEDAKRVESEAVTAHKKDMGADDMNHAIDVMAVYGQTPAGLHVPGRYIVTYEAKDHAVPAVYTTALRPSAGLTNEVLLAITLHRLTAYQGTVTACPENDRAIGHILEALSALSTRSRRVQESKEIANRWKIALDHNARVRLDHVGNLRIGTAYFSPDTLKQWGKWSDVIVAVKALDPVITPDELGTIEFAGKNIDIIEAARGVLEHTPGCAGFQGPTVPQPIEPLTRLETIMDAVFSHLADSGKKQKRHGGAHNGFIELLAVVSSLRSVPQATQA